MKPFNKRQLIEALEASDAPDDALVHLLTYSSNNCGVESVSYNGELFITRWDFEEKPIVCAWGHDLLENGGCTDHECWDHDEDCAQCYGEEDD